MGNCRHNVCRHNDSLPFQIATMEAFKQPICRKLGFPHTAVQSVNKENKKAKETMSTIGVNERYLEAI